MTTVEARAAERLTYEFVSIASHELRAPIAVVHGIAATLDARVDELPDEQVHALLSQLVVQTDRLRDLADQLLDLSRIESGAAGPAELFDPRELLAALLPRIAGDRAAGVRVLVDPGRTLVADPVAFERVAANLILNALRYGEPPVEVRVEGDPCRLVVEDRGPGVAPEFVPRLFERFSRSDESRRSNAPGAGLGLSIAAAYAKAIGGELAYEQAQPRGARFTLSLPAARS
jgi:signal transduction histidine kinase